MGAGDTLRPRQTRARWGGAPSDVPWGLHRSRQAGASLLPGSSVSVSLPATGPFKLMLRKHFTQAGQAWGPERPTQWVVPGPAPDLV